jgi:hypothetical protein
MALASRSWTLASRGLWAEVKARALQLFGGPEAGDWVLCRKTDGTTGDMVEINDDAGLQRALAASLQQLRIFLVAVSGKG